MSPRFPLLLALLLLSTSLFAQTYVEAGLSLGRQEYTAGGDDPRYITGAEVIVRGGSVGGHLAVEYADLETWDALVVTHANVIYRHAFGNHWSWLAGAGPTFVDIGDFGTDVTTFNVEAELAKRFGRTDVFARARYFDFKLGDFRDETSPKSPEVSIGFRYAFR
jgi:hypothetical protein